MNVSKTMLRINGNNSRSDNPFHKYLREYFPLKTILHPKDIETHKVIINQTNYDGLTPLHLLCDLAQEQYAIESVPLLINVGADINEVGNDPCYALYMSHAVRYLTPFEYAVKNNKIRLFTKMLECAEEIEFLKNNDLVTQNAIFSHLVKSTANFEIVSEAITSFIHKGWSCTNVDQMGNSPLHLLARQESENASRICDMLLDVGANPHILNENYLSPVDVAVSHKNIPILKSLLNAMEESTDKNTQTKQKAIKYLFWKMENAIGISTEGWFNFSQGLFRIFELLVSKNLDVNSISLEAGNTCLHKICELCPNAHLCLNPETVDLVFSDKLIHKTNHTGRLPIYFAILYANYDLVRFLIMKGSEVQIPDQTIAVGFYMSQEAYDRICAFANSVNKIKQQL